jgi:hypothetical protein
MTSGRKRDRESGAVLVMVALWLPLLAIFATFAVDVAHWFDYSRNLQNRADAAVLAGGGMYGGTCLTGSAPAQAGLNTIGQTAQKYAGPPDTTPNANLPYTFASALPYLNQPNLSQGTPANFHLLFNSKKYWDQGGTNYSMTPAGNLCDATDESGREGPILDVRVTQASLASFFSLFKFLPNISAHARVEIQPVKSANDLRPIAVREPGVTPCATAKFVDATTGAPLLDSGGQQVTVGLNRDPLVSGQPVTWSNAVASSISQGPVAVTMPPNGHHIGVQLFLSDCHGNGQLYDEANGGLLWVNSYGSGTPTASEPPRIVSSTFGTDPAPTGVTLTSTCNPYFFFSTTDCTVNVRAAVAFGVQHTNLGPPVKTQTFVKAGIDGDTDCSANGSNGAIDLTNGGGTQWTSSGGFTIPAQTGPHPIYICWKQTFGTITGLGDCSATGGNPCHGSFGIQQRVYAGFNNDSVSPVSSSGFVVLATLSEPGVWSPGADSFQKNSTHSFVATFKVSRFQISQPTDPATVIRFSLQNGTCLTDPSAPASCNNHETGLFDCGQGTGNQQDMNAITFGCPNPLQINQRNGLCLPELSTLTPPQADDCIHTTQGNRNIVCGFTNRVTSAPAGTTGCYNGTCSTNNWWAYQTSGGTIPIPPNDPRAFTMVITSPVDLSGSGPTWAPIYDFATFYVTGWDTQGQAPSCPPGSSGNSNEPYPGTGSSRKSVWGHWINYTIPGSGTGTGALCSAASQPDPTQPLNCVAVLTR